jgi:hypothetical protein
MLASRPLIVAPRLGLAFRKQVGDVAQAQAQTTGMGLPLDLALQRAGRTPSGRVTGRRRGHRVPDLPSIQPTSQAWQRWWPRGSARTALPLQHPPELRIAPQPVV